jgi:WD40 repeat protein
VTIWDAADGRVRYELPEHAAPVWAVAYSPDGARLAAASGCLPAMVDPAIEDRIGEVKIWDLSKARAAPTSRLRLIGHEYGVASLAFSPDGATLATGGFDRGVKLWDAARGGLRAELEGHKGWVAALAFSPDGSLLATGSHDQTIRLWDAADGRPRGVLRGHTGNVYSVAFSPDGSLLASGSLDGAVRLWDVDLSLDVGLDFN